MPISSPPPVEFITTSQLHSHSTIALLSPKFLYLSPSLSGSSPRCYKSCNCKISDLESDAPYPIDQVEVFGSFKTGIYLPSSDIDVVILGSDINTPQTGLHALSRALSQRGVAKKLRAISFDHCACKGCVPIIKFIEKKSGIAFDISFDVDNELKAAKFIKDALNKIPPLRPLCLILKVFLQQRELNEVYIGGIGSYALLAMLISMLQEGYFAFIAFLAQPKDSL